MSVRDDLTALCRIQAQLAALGEQRDELRRRLLDHAMDVYDADGAAPTWRAELGTVSLIVPQPKPSVFDEDAFAAYAAEHYGDAAIETVRRVVPGLRTAILETITEVNESAGVTMNAAFPSLRVVLTKEAKAAAAVEMEQATDAA